MMGYRAYRVLRARIERGQPSGCGLLRIPEGAVVYDLRGYDYGLASDDTRTFGIEYVSVTLKANGDYPGFTIPRRDLEDIGPAPLTVTPTPPAPPPPEPHPPSQPPDRIGAAEHSVGRYVYRRIEALMGVEPDTPEAQELKYLTGITEGVEEYGEEACAGYRLAAFPQQGGK